MGLEVMLIFKPVEVKALPDYRLWLRYEDGAEGTVDVSYLVGRGVFSLWEDQNAFEGVSIGPYGEVAWGDDIELCPDTLYFQLTGKTPEEVFVLNERVDA